MPIPGDLCLIVCPRALIDQDMSRAIVLASHGVEQVDQILDLATLTAQLRSGLQIGERLLARIREKEGDLSLDFPPFVVPAQPKP